MLILQWLSFKFCEYREKYENSEEGAALVSPGPIGSVYFRLPSSQELNVNPPEKNATFCSTSPYRCPFSCSSNHNFVKYCNNCIRDHMKPKLVRGQSTAIKVKFSESHGFPPIGFCAPMAWACLALGGYWWWACRGRAALPRGLPRPLVTRGARHQRQLGIPGIYQNYQPLNFCCFGVGWFCLSWDTQLK